MSKLSKAPRIPAAIRRLGALAPKRTVGNNWSVSFALTDEAPSAPGNGTAIVAALSKHFGSRFAIDWNGSQSDAIILRTNACPALPKITGYDVEELAGLGPITVTEIGEENVYFTLASGAAGFFKR